MCLGEPLSTSYQTHRACCLRCRRGYAAKPTHERQLSAKHGFSIHLHFVYGHCGCPEGDAVDELARSAATRGADTDRLQHFTDICRASNQETRARENENASGASKTLKQKAGLPAEPTRWQQSHGIPSAQLAFLCQLRTNACATLGGHLVERYVCPACHAPTERAHPTLQAMVEHAFNCRIALPLRREERIRSMRNLWTQPARTLRYIAKFIHTFNRVA